MLEAMIRLWQPKEGAGDRTPLTREELAERHQADERKTAGAPAGFHIYADVGDYA